MKNITKTSRQAQIEKELKRKNGDNICPECSRPALGTVAVRNGFFKTEKMKEYRCFDCGCEWNTGWKRV